MLNKLIVLTLTLAVSFFASADDYQELKDKELYQAAKALAVSLNELGAKIKECEKDKPVLSGDIFKGLNLTHKEAYTALLYFEQVNDIACLKEADTSFIISTLVWGDALKNSSDEPLEGFDKDKVEIMKEIAISAYITMNKLQVRYAAIPEEKRVKIEDIKELKSRFNASKTFEAIEAASK